MVHSRHIVVVTDCTDVATTELKATLLRHLSPEVNADINIVTCEEFSLVNASFLVRLLADQFPPERTTYLSVVNPLTTKRTDRARIFGRTKNGASFVGENTGVFNWLIQDFGLEQLYESPHQGLKGNDFVSFGGKYFHAPIAAKIVSGVPLSQLGDSRTVSFLRDYSVCEGTVVHIDNFGVAKIKGRMPLFEEGTRLEVLVNHSQVFNAFFTHCMKDLPDGTVAMYPGSSLQRIPEIGIVRDKHGIRELLKIGDIVTARTTHHNPSLRTFLDTGMVTWMRSEDGFTYGIHPLNRFIAANFSQGISDIHNLIPHVQWSSQDIQADSIDGREFKNKWEYSFVLFTQEYDIIGVSFAYERESEPPHYLEPCIYLHRGAVLTDFRGKQVGIGMVGSGLETALKKAETASFLHQGTIHPVKLQTTTDNDQATSLYKGFGGEIIGTKKYPSKEDFLFGFSPSRVYASPLFGTYLELKKRGAAVCQS